MTAGEFNFDNIFRQVPGGTVETDATLEEIPFPPVSYVLWIIFIILMPILLNNLLVGYHAYGNIYYRLIDSRQLQSSLKLVKSVEFGVLGRINCMVIMMVQSLVALALVL